VSTHKDRGGGRTNRKAADKVAEIQKSFAHTRSITATAKACGVSWGTAKKYVTDTKFRRALVKAEEKVTERTMTKAVMSIQADTATRGRRVRQLWDLAWNEIAIMQREVGEHRQAAAEARAIAQTIKSPDKKLEALKLAAAHLDRADKKAVELRYHASPKNADKIFRAHREEEERLALTVEETGRLMHDLAQIIHEEEDVATQRRIGMKVSSAFRKIMGGRYAPRETAAEEE